MRTTLVIDDQVFKDAKRRAVEAGISLSELTTLALRETLRQRRRPVRDAEFSMPTYGAGAKRGYSPDEIANLRDEGR